MRRQSHHDSAARLAGLGIDVFLGEARFAGTDVIDAGGRRLRFSRAIIAERAMRCRRFLASGTRAT